MQKHILLHQDNQKSLSKAKTNHSFSGFIEKLAVDFSTKGRMVPQRSVRTSEKTNL